MKRNNLKIRRWIAKPRNRALVAFAAVVIVVAGVVVGSRVGKTNQQVPSYEPIVIEGGSELLGKQVAGSDSHASPKKLPPRFDKYIGMPMGDVSNELGVSYDAATSRQIKVVKDGYALMIEDGGKDDPNGSLKNTATGLATYSAIELSEMGTCVQSQVYDRIDEAMRLVGLDPVSKGQKHTDGGKGYGAFRDYSGDSSREIALQCLYEGDRYELLIKTLPAYR